MSTIISLTFDLLTFLQSYGCINILCHIFNSAWNKQQQLVIFVVKKHWLLLQNIISQVVDFSVCSKCPPAFTQARSLFEKLNMALLIESCGAAGPISTAELSWAHRCSPAWLKWLVALKHCSPDMVVQRVEVRRVRRPFIFTNEFTVVGSNASWASFAVCAGAQSCWKMKPDGKTDLQS